MKIYLDNAATTKMSPEVLGVMIPYLTEEYGNAGSMHRLGRNAADAIRKAREQAALLLGCSPDHVIFTSGGSESNSMVLAGLRKKLIATGKRHIIVSAIEHDSVIKAAKALIKDGFEVTFLKPNVNGRISPDQVESEIRPDTGLVSVMFVNNETGTVNNVRGIGRVCEEHSVPYHMDCVQAAGLYSLNAADRAAFASVSGHKIHGPKGVGALYIRDMNALDPIVYGGAMQEFGLRGGTENVAGIVGFGCACAETVNDISTAKVSDFRYQFYVRLLDAMEELGIDTGIVHVNGMQATKHGMPGRILNLRFDGIDGESMLVLLDANAVYVSAGSACHSHEVDPSHVLKAMGLSDEEARSSIRISFSKYNTSQEVEQAARAFAHCINILKQAN